MWRKIFGDKFLSKTFCRQKFVKWFSGNKKLPPYSCIFVDQILSMKVFSEKFVSITFGRQIFVDKSVQMVGEGQTYRQKSLDNFCRQKFVDTFLHFCRQIFCVQKCSDRRKMGKCSDKKFVDKFWSMKFVDKIFQQQFFDRTI